MLQNRSLPDDSAAFQALLDARAGHTNIQVAEIRQRVCSIVDKMKNDGAPPEKVVVAVKAAVLSIMRPLETLAPAEFLQAERMLQQALSWCLDQYYGPHSKSN